MMTKISMVDLSKYKANRKLQVEYFLNSLGEEWTPMTIKDIRIKFFKNSRSFTDTCLKDLEEAGVIEKKSGQWSYVNGRHIMNSNLWRKVKLEVTKTQSVIEEEEFWRDWNPKIMIEEPAPEDADFGEANGIEGLIETIDV